MGFACHFTNTANEHRIGSALCTAEINAIIEENLKVGNVPQNHVPHTSLTVFQIAKAVGPQFWVPVLHPFSPWAENEFGIATLGRFFVTLLSFDSILF